jgi:hypothetical protein
MATKRELLKHKRQQMAFDFSLNDHVTRFMNEDVPLLSRCDFSSESSDSLRNITDRKVENEACA